MADDNPKSAERRMPIEFGVIFAPSTWSAIERFRKFVGPPFKSERDLRKGVNTTAGHLHKFEVLAGLANKLAPTLAEDNAELEERGHTPAARSKEYAAVVETLICSLYSAIDGIRLAIYGVYKGIAKVQKGSNGELFENAHDKKYGAGFPEPIRVALAEAQADWFPTLRKYRTELIHGEVGSCHLDKASGNIRYMHTGLGSAARAMVIEDIVAELVRLHKAVYCLAESVYGYLYRQLDQITHRTVCGFYKGRMYEREVTPEPDVSFQSGVCRSLSWFENQPGYECPLRTCCGAYARAKHPGPQPPASE